MSQFTFFPASGGGTGYAQLQDDDSPTPNLIGTPVAIPAGTTVDVTAPHGTVMTTDGVDAVMDVLSGGSANLPQTIFRYKDAFDVQQDSGSFDTLYTAPYLRPDLIFPRAELKDSNDDGIGVYATALTLATDTIQPIPDSAVTVNSTPFANVTSTAGLDVPVKDDAGTDVGSNVSGVWVVKLDPLKVVFGAGDAVSLLFTATVEEAGSYNAGSIGTGTLQVSINGGAFASGAFSLSIGQTFQAKRSAFTTQETATWVRS